MDVLALNCGSSSIKFAVFDGHGLQRRGRGSIERFGAQAHARLEPDGAPPREEAVAVRDHAEGVRRIVEWVRTWGRNVEAVGHRVVHGGPRFVESARIDDEVITAIEALE